tara:strand:- start:37 stop:501 length:465 start_codon:yes stop_codon:yes gene_type:complete
METLVNLLNDFSKKYPQLKNVNIELVPYNNLYIARCLVDKIGDYINVKKGRIINVIPRKILLTNIVLNKKRENMLFIFIHECTHGITPQRERKVKNSYIRIDHSRQFYENFLELLSYAYELNYISYKFNSVEELMKRDNRNENVKNDLKLYHLH